MKDCSLSLADVSRETNDAAEGCSQRGENSPAKKKKQLVSRPTLLMRIRLILRRNWTPKYPNIRQECKQRRARPANKGRCLSIKRNEKRERMGRTYNSQF